MNSLRFVAFFFLFTWYAFISAEPQRALADEVSKKAPNHEKAPRQAIFEMVRNVKPAAIVVAKGEHKGVLAAAKDLQRDVTKITGVTPNIVSSLEDTGGKCVVIGTADCAEGRALLASVGLGIDDLEGKWETFKWRVLNDVGGKEQVLAIAGSNVRGTIFGVYDFEQKHMGVDPFWFWADHEPPTRGELVFDASVNFGPSQEPTWKYRGWTLNDHPQFMEWMESGLVHRARYSRYMFNIHHEVLDRLMEASLRLKMNMFTWYFIDIDWQPDRERLQAVADRGMFVTQHQMEAVGADTGFWNTYWENHNPAGKPKEFSYRLHPEAFREFWSFYIKRWAELSPQVVWELNLRGWADAVYEEPSLPDGGTHEQRAEILNQAIADQARLVREYDPNPDLEMMTTLYHEVGKYYDKGWITVPEGVTTGFADAGMSGMSYSKRFWTEKRDPKRKYGQYFHTQYFGGGPQIAKCTPIEEYLKVNMDAMFQRGDTQHMLLAMNELRHQQIEVRAIAEMLWDYPGFKPREYMLRYCKEEYGKAAAEKVLSLYDQYYEKYPHRTRDDGFKKIPSYYKVMEPLFRVNANLQNIITGTRDGMVINYQYDKEVYERGIRDLGEVLQAARELRPSIPENRQYFFDYEFIDAIRQIRGIYRISIATNEAISQLKEGDREGALAVLLNARPLVEELYAAFKNTRATEKWKYWYRSGTNEDVYLMYNLYQKARLRLEVEPMSPVSGIEPQRRPYLGNVAMHDPAGAGDQVYGNQPERINSSFYNGARHSLLQFPLKNTFQIGGVRSTARWIKDQKPDYGLPYRFTLKSKATVYVARQQGQTLDWLERDGFAPTGQTLEVGYWGWPYRYRNRPPDEVHTFELFAKDFPDGTVDLGKNPAHSRDGLPYIVFIKPAMRAYENFHRETIGQPPSGWRIEPHGGRAIVVDNPDYDGEIRPTVFDLATVRRYRPLDLKSLELRTTAVSQAPTVAELSLTAPLTENGSVHFRVKPGQTDQTTGFSLVTGEGNAPVAIEFTRGGRLTARGSGGKPVEIASYEPGRWYNLTLHVSPKQRRFSVRLQDDQIQETIAENLSFACLVEKPLSKISLWHSNEREGSWIRYDAISAYAGTNCSRLHEKTNGTPP